MVEADAVIVGIGIVPPWRPGRGGSDGDQRA
jgi:hypothetical protein